MHILVCDDDAAFSAKVAEYAVTYFEAHEIPVQATVCSDPEQVLAIPDLELYRIAFLDVDMPQVNGIALGGQLLEPILGAPIHTGAENLPQNFTALLTGGIQQGYKLALGDHGDLAELVRVDAQ